MTLPLIALLWSGAAEAQTVIQQNLFVAKRNQNVWAPGAGTSVNVPQKFLGIDVNEGKTFGPGFADPCPLVSCPTGLEVGARFAAKLGIGASFKLDGGTADFQLPGAAQFIIPAAAPPGQLTLGSSFISLPSLSLPTQAGGPLVARPAQMQVRGPGLQASYDMFAELSGFAGTRVCIVGACGGPSIGPFAVNESKPIYAVNPNGDGSLRLLGQKVGSGQPVTGLNGNLTVAGNVPDLTGQATGLLGNQLVSTRRDSLVALNLNVTGAISGALGLPLAGKIGPLGYNILTTEVGLGFDVEQRISFQPNVVASLLFSEPVSLVTGGVAQAASRTLSFRLGDAITIQTGPSVGALSFVPTLTLGGTFSNTTDLIVAGNVGLTALGLSLDTPLGTISAGPLVNDDNPFDLARLNLYSRSFDVGFGSVDLAPVDIDLRCRSNFGSVEFPLFGVCASSGFNEVVVPGANGFDLPRLTPFSCSSGIPGNSFYPVSCSNNLFGRFSGSRFTEVNGVRIYVNDVGAVLGYEPVVPGTNTTDADLKAALAAVGYAGGRGPFEIPPGGFFDPTSPIPEPQTWAMMILGFGAVGTAMRRKRVAGVSRV